MANNSAIQAMLASGADAQKNMFDVWVTFPWDADNEVALSVRAKDFQVQAAEVEVDTRAYHGTEISVPKTSISFDRTFSLNFRLDASYALYQQFITWHSTVADPVSGGVANWANATGKVRVQALSGTYAATSVNEYIDTKTTYAISDKDDNAEWTFYDVWVTKVGQPSFTGGKESGAAEYEVSFKFGDCDYPFYANGAINGLGTGGFVAN